MLDIQSIIRNPSIRNSRGFSIYLQNSPRVLAIVLALIFGIAIPVWAQSPATVVLGQTDSGNNPIFFQGLVNNGSSTTNSVGFNSPGPTALDTVSHRLFVSDAQNNRVLVFLLNNDNTPQDLVADYVLGQPNFNAKSPATTQTGMNSPTGLFYEPVNNRLFVADTGNNRVLMFSLGALNQNGIAASIVLGQPNFLSNTPGTTDTVMRSPTGLTYNPSRSQLFVSDTGNNRIILYDLSVNLVNGKYGSGLFGQLNWSLSSPGTSDQTYNAPAGISYDQVNDRLFVADAGNNRVIIQSINFNLPSLVLGQASFTSNSPNMGSGSPNRAGLSSPKAIKYDPVRQRIFVADSANHRILVFDVKRKGMTNGKGALFVIGQTSFTQAVSPSPPTASSFNTPTGLDYDVANFKIYSADGGNHRVLRHDLPALTIDRLASSTNSLILQGDLYNEILSTIGGGGIYNYSVVTGTLPPGLSLNADTGSIAGTPIGAGVFCFTIHVQDQHGLFDEKEYILHVKPNTASSAGAPYITTPYLPYAPIGFPYDITLTAAGGVPPYRWSAAALPFNFRLNPCSGRLEADLNTNSTGTLTLQITVVDVYNNPVTQTFALANFLTSTKCTALTTEVRDKRTGEDAIKGQYFEALVYATGCPKWLHFTASGLPPGLGVFDTGNDCCDPDLAQGDVAKIKGTPTTPGIFAFTLYIDPHHCELNGCQRASPFILVVKGVGITTNSLPQGSVGTPYTAPLTASGGTPAYTWSTTALPPGLSINSSTGEISGTPTAIGSSTVTVTVRDATGDTANTAFTLTISGLPTIGISPPSLSFSAVQGGASPQPQALSIANTGGGTLNWSAAKTQSWLTLSSSTGSVSSGDNSLMTVSANSSNLSPGTYTDTITVSDTSGQSAQKNIAVTLTVIQAYALNVSKSGSGSGTVISSPAGINCGSDCTESYNQGTPISLIATPDPTSTFAGWGGTCSGAGNCTVTMDAAKSVIATFSPIPTYALTITKNGSGIGTVTSNPAGINCGSDCTESYFQGTAVTLTATQPTGSTFTGWGGACSSTATTCTLTMDTVKSVTAVFDMIPTYTLTVTPSGSSTGTVTSNPAGINCGSDCTESYFQGTAVTLTATQPTGSAFTGWGGACSSTATTCTLTMDAVKSVIASFNLVPTYTLNVSKDGNGTGTVSSSPSGINCGPDCTEVYNQNTLVALTASAAAGSAFTGWGGACSGTGICTVTMDAAKSVTATYALQIYSLTVFKSGTGNGTVSSSPAGITCGADCTESYTQNAVVSLSATADGTSIFLGWSGACSGAGPCTVTMDSSKSVTGIFHPAGSVGLSATPTSIAAGATVTAAWTGITTPTATDWLGLFAPGATVTSYLAFSNTTGTASGSVPFLIPTTLTPGTYQLRLYAKGGSTLLATSNALIVQSPLPTFTLSVSKSGTGTGTITSNPTGISCGTACNTSFDSGTVVTLTATADANSNFTGWSGACAGASTCTITMDSTKSVTATFNSVAPQTFALTLSRNGTGTGTITSNPAGINCGSTCSVSYNSGTVVSLTATANTGSTFAGWSGACSGTGTCNVTMDNAKSVTASFNLIPPQTFALTVSKSGTGTGTITSNPVGINCGITCNASYNSGIGVSLTATADANSNFTGWSGACTGAGTCTVTMDNARSVTASFNSTAGALVITTTSLPDGIVGVAYTGQLQASGGAAPYSWSLLVSGSLSYVDLHLNSDGSITGTPILEATLFFTVRVTDGNGATATKSNLSITINPPPLIITIPPLASGIVAQVYTASLSADGGTPPYTWSIESGSLPQGLDIDSNQEKILGTPTQAGTFTFALRATDSAARTVDKNLSIMVAAATELAILTNNLPVGYVLRDQNGNITGGTDYFAQLEANENGSKPYSWTGVDGSLPPGLILRTDPITSKGIIEGQTRTTGVSTFKVQVTDKQGKTATQALTLTIGTIGTGYDLTIVPVTLPDATLGTNYSAPLQAAVAVPNLQLPLTWFIGLGALPNGLQIVPDEDPLSPKARIAGIPGSTPRTYAFTVTAIEKHHGGVAKLALTLNVKSACGGDNRLVIPTQLSSMGAVGTSYEATLGVDNPPAILSWSVCKGSLPDGLSIDSSTGRITGTPTTPTKPEDIRNGFTVFTVKVFDPNTLYSGEKAYEIVIIEVPGSPAGNIDIKTPASVNRVDGFDLGALERAFGTTTGNNRWNVAADLNKDGRVDGSDLGIQAANFGRVRP